MNIITLFWNYRAKGLNDWLAQRYSVVPILLYAIPVLVLPWFSHNVGVWRAVLFHPVMKVLGTAAAFSILWHSKIGLWVVITDYLPRGIIQRLATLAMYIYVWLFFLVALFLFWIEL